MNTRAFVMLITWGLAAIAGAPLAGAQGTPGSEPSSGGSKPPLAEIRSIVHELQGHTDKLRELMSEYRSLVERRPQPEGGNPEAKKAHDEQLAKWSAALDRLLRRVEQSHAVVVEAKQRLDQSAKGQLPTALARDVANAHNEAEAERASAAQALAKRPAPARASKGPKDSASAKPKPSTNDELDDL